MAGEKRARAARQRLIGGEMGREGRSGEGEG